MTDTNEIDGNVAQIDRFEDEGGAIPSEDEFIDFDLEYEASVEAFTMEMAPKQIRSAATMIRDYYSDKNIPEGTISISVVNGQVKEILLIDTASLSKLESAVIASLQDDIEVALNTAEQERIEVFDKQVGEFNPDTKFNS